MTIGREERIRQTKLTVFNRDSWRCCHVDARGNRCQRSASECAHEIGQGHVEGIKSLWNSTYHEHRNSTFIEVHVIHNPINMKASCTTHNPYFNIGFKPTQVKAKLEEIRKDLKNRGIIK